MSAKDAAKAVVKEAAAHEADAPETIEKPMWFDEIGPGGSASGFFQADPRHPVLFVKRRRPILMVTFDNLSNVNDRSPARLPWAFKFARDNQVSHLGVYANLGNWYRDEGLIARLQGLAADGFFEGYARCVFTGSSMGAFAALSFARLAPGAMVLAFNPQSTLDEALVPWETRYRTGRRQDWTLPMGDAAEAIDRLGRAYVFYDPYFAPDQAHVDRLLAASGGGDRVTLMKCWYSKHKSGVFLRKIEALKPIMQEALFGDLTEERFYALYRARRRLPWYRGALEHYFREKGRPAMADRATASFKKIAHSHAKPHIDRSV